MRARSVINDKLDHMDELADFVREALHDVFHQHAHDLRSVAVLVFN